MTFSESFYHDILCPERAEELLIEDKSYLLRRSPLNPDKFILSYFVNNHVKHDIVESASDKHARKNVSFEDISAVVEEMVLTNPSCEHPVVSLRRQDSAPGAGRQGYRGGNDKQTQEEQTECCGDEGCRGGNDEQTQE